MNKPIEAYYETELAFVTDFARDFSKQFPAEAGRLVPDTNRAADPHADRFIEAFALLAGRIHHKLDDEFPELTEAMLGVLYPHFLAPVPSMGIAQFELDPSRARFPDGYQIARHTRLRSRVFGKPPTACRWRTAYPVTLWPIQVTEARWQRPPFPAGLTPPPRTVAALRLRLQTLADLSFARLSIARLRFYLGGEKQLIASLYEALFNHVTQVVFRCPDRDLPRPVFALTPAQCLHQVGFERDQDVLPFPPEAFVGHRLLTELLSFPDKFHFLDLGGWPHVRRAEFGQQMELILFLNRTRDNLEQGISAQNFRLGCTPVVNVFAKSAEPIAFEQTKHAYRVVPDRTGPLSHEVYSVEEVRALDPERGQPLVYQPFYTFAHDQTRDSQRQFYYASRRAARADGDAGTEVYLTLVDLDFDPHQRAEAVLDVQTLCTNRDLASRFHRAGDELLIEAGGPAPQGVVRLLQAPTPPLRPPLRRTAHWRLLAQLCLNHVPLVGHAEARDALQEILRLCDFADPELTPQLAAVNRQLIEGVTGLESQRGLARVGGGAHVGLCRGYQLTLELDEQKYVGTGAFLVACVLERFLGYYAAINSFSQLRARTRQGEGYFKQWPPRAADRQLL
jgi:type VI secretion system protein ImpG